nr:nucleolar protein 58-like [Tanacetum cinerariifolium]
MLSISLHLQVINDLKKCSYKKDNYELNYKFLNKLQPEWKQYGTLMRQTKNLMDINIDALYNILKQNQGDVNGALGYKKKAVVVTSDPLALVAEKTNMSKRKDKVVVSSYSKGSGTDDFSELKKITTLLAKAFNRRKFYSKPTKNNLRTSSTSQSINKKQEFVKTDDKKEDKKAEEKKRDMRKVKCYNCKKEGHFAKDCKKAKVKDYNYYKTKMLLAKKDSDKQVLIAEDQAWMESSSDFDREINANMVFVAQIEKVLLESDKSSSSAEETIAENFFLDAIESASENFIENHIDSQKTMIRCASYIYLQDVPVTNSLKGTMYGNASYISEMTYYVVSSIFEMTYYDASSIFEMTYHGASSIFEMTYREAPSIFEMTYHDASVILKILYHRVDAYWLGFIISERDVYVYL